MLDLEEQVTRVWDPDVRTIAREASRCYGIGAHRAAITLTWVAVCTDLIAKISRLADGGEATAAAARGRIETAQTHGLSPAGVQAMQTAERDLVKTAVELELIDTITARDLEAAHGLGHAREVRSTTQWPVPQRHVPPAGPGAWAGGGPGGDDRLGRTRPCRQPSPSATDRCSRTSGRPWCLATSRRRQGRRRRRVAQPPGLPLPLRAAPGHPGGPGDAAAGSNHVRGLPGGVHARGGPSFSGGPLAPGHPSFVA